MHGYANQALTLIVQLAHSNGADGRVVRLVSGLCRPCSGRVSVDQGTLTKMCP